MLGSVEVCKCNAEQKGGTHYHQEGLHVQGSRTVCRTLTQQCRSPKSFDTLIMDKTSVQLYVSTIFIDNYKVNFVGGGKLKVAKLACPLCGVVLAWREKP